MNPLLPVAISTLWSCKKEFLYVLFTFLFVFSLPVLSVIVVTNTGIHAISDKLVSFDLKTHEIEIHDPVGNKVNKFSIATVWPVKGAITLKFGESDLPYQPFHTGIDIANLYGKIGDPITPFMKGRVIYAGEISWGYGKHIIIDHGNQMTSLYGHLSAIYVKVGDEVQPGDIIGKEGQTGWATGPHLHFEIRVFGIPVDPQTFL